MLVADTAPNTNGTIINNFSLQPTFVGSGAHFQVWNVFSDALRHCLSGRGLCIKCEAVRNWESTEMAAIAAEYVAVFIHSIRVNRPLFNNCFYIITKLISTTLRYKAAFASRKLDFAVHTAYWKHWLKNFCPVSLRFYVTWLMLLPGRRMFWSLSCRTFVNLASPQTSWHSITNVGYISVTANYIDENWHTICLILATQSVEEQHG